MAEFRLSNFTDGSVLTAAELNTGLTFTDYTPDWTQSATITKTVNWARYTKFGKFISGSIKMTATGSGTAANDVLVGLPVAASSNNYLIGNGIRIYAGESYIRPYFAIFNSSTTVKFLSTASTTQTGFSQAQVLSGDVIYLQFTYEAA